MSSKVRIVRLKMKIPNYVIKDQNYEINCHNCIYRVIIMGQQAKLWDKQSKVRDKKSCLWIESCCYEIKVIIIVEIKKYGIKSQICEITDENYEVKSPNLR